MSTVSEVRSIDSFDLDKYLGLWFEIGRLPLKWEDDGATDVTAHYSLEDDGGVRVDNRCYNDDGKPTQSVGKAEAVDGEVAQLKVSFLPAGLRWIPFTSGDYWVLKIDPDYRHALVGTPDHKNLWLLAREHTVSPEIVDEYRREAVRQGFDLADWITTPQSGRTVTDDLLD